MALAIGTGFLIGMITVTFNVRDRVVERHRLKIAYGPKDHVF